MIKQHKIDILWYMTDPRFFDFLFDIEDEIRSTTSMIYYTIWDNLPYPTFNKPFYLSNDFLACISKLTHDVVSKISPEVQNCYLPHSIDLSVFRKLNEDQVKQFKMQHFGDRFLVFWNSRNARRKMSGSIIWWFKEFLDRVGNDKSQLLMHRRSKGYQWTRS